jgi:putative ABC transport system ATP-binding protein
VAADLSPQVSPSDAIIHLRQVGLTYPGLSPVKALRPADLAVKAGEYVTIVGRSGSGKSTLLNVIGLLDRPTSGRYLLRGMDTSELSDGERASMRAREIGFVFQEFHLLPYRTACENVAMSLLYHGRRRRDRIDTARECLARVGLAHREGALPPEMSGGERQRVAVARALASRPGLLLCDEPTGNLDIESAEVVLQLVEDLRSDGITVVLITHDPRIAALGTRRITMTDGALSETDLTPIEVSNE